MIRRLHCILMLLVMSCSVHVSAKLKEDKRLDSLLGALHEASEDTNKVNIIIGLVSQRYQWNNDDSGINLMRQAIAVADKLGWKTGLARSYYFLGRCYRHRNNYLKALENTLVALRYAEGEGHTFRIAMYAEEVGAAYSQLNDHLTAMGYYFKALKLAESINDTDKIARVNLCLADVFLNQREYSRALEYQNKAVKLFQAVGNKRETAWTLCAIGQVYIALGENELALEYSFEGLQLSDKIGFSFGVEYACKSISEVYANKEEYVLAVSFGKKCLEICMEIGDNYYTSQALCNLGGIYASIVDVNVVKSGSLYQGENTKGVYISDALIPDGREERLKLAITYLQGGLDSAKKINALAVMLSCYESLAKTYKLAREFEKAIDCYQNYGIIKDSIFSQKTASDITRLELKNKMESDSLKSEQARSLTEIKLRQQRNYTYIAVLAGMGLLGFSLFMKKNNKLLSVEKKRTEELILNILPEDTAIELKNTGTSAARHYDNVTVLFTDFVNFTRTSEQMSPQGLIDELHTCFKAFDEITGKYNIEKIKTIGDAYLAVCGLPSPDPKHAEHIVKAAIEINAFMADRFAKLGNRTFEVRIGIHSGSVVAGIVGVKKFAYDIWGDTVNTAARMEQHGAAGRINISETTYNLVKDKFNCEYRGEVEAKGKGVMKMYFVG